MTRYYSQNGEDFLLDQMLGGKSQGLFIEVGCIDGCRFSNTLSFEERGWRGICVEAHADYIELLRRNRPGSAVHHCAAGAADADRVTFYANARGSLSTLDRENESLWRKRYGRYFSGFNNQTVRKRRLDTILREQGVEQIDILSIDVEGTEVEVLHGLDLSEYRPSVVVVEAVVGTDEQVIDALMTDNGYVRLLRLSENVFYVDDADLGATILGQVFECDLVRTPHPLDGGGERRIRMRIDTRSGKDARCMQLGFRPVVQRLLAQLRARVMA